MRGGSNGQGNFTFMHAIPSGLGHVLVWSSLVLQQATGRWKEDPLPREVARQGSPQREGGPFRHGVWGVIGARNTNVPSSVPRPARIGVTSCTLELPPCRRPFPSQSSPSILPYITWLGQDTLFTCQFHSLFKIKKKHTYIHSLTPSLSFSFLSVGAWSGPFCPCHACPGDG